MNFLGTLINLFRNKSTRNEQLSSQRFCSSNEMIELKVSNNSLESIPETVIKDRNSRDLDECLRENPNSMYKLRKKGNSAPSFKNDDEYILYEDEDQTQSQVLDPVETPRIIMSELDLYYSKNRELCH